MAGTVEDWGRLTDAERHDRWRAHIALECGCTQKEAEQIVSNKHVDLHDLVDLVERGCPTGLALRILV